jgi:hypothetical protein
VYYVLFYVTLASGDTEVMLVTMLCVFCSLMYFLAQSHPQGLNYQRLCRRTLDVIISVLASSGPLGLAREPRDCVDAFADFIGQQMVACEYAIENEAQAQILVRRGLLPFVFCFVFPSAFPVSPSVLFLTPRLR